MGAICLPLVVICIHPSESTAVIKGRLNCLLDVKREIQTDTKNTKKNRGTSDQSWMRGENALT